PWSAAQERRIAGGGEGAAAEPASARRHGAAAGDFGGVWVSGCGPEFECGRSFRRDDRTARAAGAAGADSRAAGGSEGVLHRRWERCQAAATNAVSCVSGT